MEVDNESRPKHSRAATKKPGLRPAFSQLRRAAALSL